MQEKVAEIYNTLSLSAQEEVYDFMMYLAQKQEKSSFDIQERSKKEKKIKALSEFGASMKEAWKAEDGLEYQNKLREERNLV